MPEPGHNRVAHPAGRGRLRASHADREQVVDILKDAYVRDRLTKDEFDSRVGDALASRTHADLAALTADLPARPPAPRPPRKPARARPQRPEDATVKKGAVVVAATTVLTGAVWAGALGSQADGQALGLLVWSFTFLWLGSVILVGSVMLESRRQDHSGRQLPPASGPGGLAPAHTVSGDLAGPYWPGGLGGTSPRPPGTLFRSRWSHYRLRPPKTSRRGQRVIVAVPINKVGCGRWRG